MKRARLVMFDDEKRDLEMLGFEGLQDPPTCATCKHGDPIKETELLCCGRESDDDALMGCALVMGDHVATRRHSATLVVAADFGCVQWEGRK